jgi:hypothetical protein
MTVVKVLHEVAENGQLWEHLNYLWGRDNLHHCEQSFLEIQNHSTYLLLQVDSLESQRVCNNRERNEIIV